MTLPNETHESRVGESGAAEAVAPAPRPAASRRLRWTDVIDLEARLRADEAWPPEDLHARDRAIGARIGARDRSDRSAVIAWLHALRADSAPGSPSSEAAATSAGARARHWREQLAAILMLAGFLIGAAAAAGWLATARREPINVIDLWPVLIGSQIGLVVLWLIAALPSISSWPVVGPLHALLRIVMAWVPRAVARGMALVSKEAAETWAMLLSEMKRLDWLYGRLRFWLLARLSQVFAIAFNLGAIVAFVVMPTIDDPAFGWRSRLLDEQQVLALSDALSAPFAWAWPDARPSEAVVRTTRHSSVAERYAAEGRAARSGRVTGSDSLWAAWWPFMLASLVAYGLVPRILYWLCAWLGMRRALAGVSFDRPEIARLAERLRQSVVDTAALAPETGTRIDAGAFSLPAAASLAFERMRSVCWESVPLDDDALFDLLEARFGPRPERSGGGARVGGLDRAGDEVVLAKLSNLGAGEGVYLVMASWEPPVGDHIDFVEALRKRAGASTPIVVALYNRDPAGATIAPEPEQLLVWRRRIARMADPRMSVDALVAETQRDGPRSSDVADVVDTVDDASGGTS